MVEGTSHGVREYILGQQKEEWFVLLCEVLKIEREYIVMEKVTKIPKWTIINDPQFYFLE